MEASTQSHQTRNRRTVSGGFIRLPPIVECVPESRRTGQVIEVSTSDHMVALVLRQHLLVLFMIAMPIIFAYVLPVLGTN